MTRLFVLLQNSSNTFDQLPWKKIGYFFTVFLVICVTWSVYRDIHIERNYTHDLRNRVVGARLQQSGISPYYYKWKSSDGPLFYDPQNFSEEKVSDITATPLLHHLLRPLLVYSNRTISRIWLGIEYLMLALIFFVSISVSREQWQKAFVKLVASLLLLTEAWKYHILAGQYYIFLPALMLLCYFFLRKKSYLDGFFAGIVATLLLGIRPNALIFFLPLIFLIRNYSWRYLLSFSAPVLAMMIIFLSSSFERRLWSDYFSAVNEHAEIHMTSGFTNNSEQASPKLKHFDGWDMEAVKRSQADYPAKIIVELGNFHYLFYKIFGIQLTRPHLLSITVFLIIVIMGVYYLAVVKKHTIGLPQLVVLGFCLYLITELFSPIKRFQYNAVQWAGPLMLFAAKTSSALTITFFVALIGLLLNVSTLYIVGLEHTIGEFIMLCSLLIAVFSNNSFQHDEL